MSRCIFCREPTSGEPAEHIIPEGLVGHRKFTAKIEGPIYAEVEDFLVLDDDEVCHRCNTERLNELDEYLQKQLGFLKVVWNDIGTKSGNAAKVERPGLFAQQVDGRPRIVLNDEDEPVTTDDGVVVQPSDDSPRSVEMADFQIEGSIASFKMSQQVRINKRVVRALYKIAFETLCHRKGAEYVLASEFDSIREYVAFGRGNREIAFKTEAEPEAWTTPQIHLRRVPTAEGWLGVVRLGPAFYIDLTPDNSIVTAGEPEDFRSIGMVRWSDKDGGHPVDVRN